MTTIRITPSLLNQVARGTTVWPTRSRSPAAPGRTSSRRWQRTGRSCISSRRRRTTSWQRRDAAFADHEAAHRAAADNLRSIALRFAEQEEINAAAVRLD